MKAKLTIALDGLSEGKICLVMKHDSSMASLCCLNYLDIVGFFARSAISINRQAGSMEGVAGNKTLIHYIRLSRPPHGDVHIALDMIAKKTQDVDDNPSVRVFECEISEYQFREAIVELLIQINREFSMKEYKRLWGHEFPSEVLEQLISLPENELLKPIF